jgi:hypothetical protein
MAAETSQSDKPPKVQKPPAPPKPKPLTAITITKGGWKDK